MHINYRGSGYATEAARALISYGFYQLGLHRIFADASNQNTASLKIMERLGMRREGHFREARFEDGKWVDLMVYSILADEWQANNQFPE